MNRVVNINNYIRNSLLSMGEDEYKNFSSGLMPTVNRDCVIGIRIPKLRKFAKTLNNYEDFLNDLPHMYFEENNLHAFLIEREKNFDKCIELIDKFLPFVDNWAICDSMKPDVLKKNPDRLIKHIKRWIKSDEIYRVRYAINLLMSYYLDDRFDKEYFSMVLSIKSDEYYINMMRAWYFATALFKKYDEARSVLENDSLDKWTHNKTIQKAIESYRVTKEQKEYLRTLKRK